MLQAYYEWRLETTVSKPEILLKTLKLRLEDGTETKITRTNAKDFFSQYGEILEVTEEM